jgi:[amino group carrier protein]-L-2-aminoadipate 6-kinase
MNDQRVIVVKIGGGAGIDVEACLDDVAVLRHAGQQLVLVHGGADETSELGERLGHPARFLTHPNGMTSRHSDRETVEILAMACAGRRNTTIVEGLYRRNVPAVGLSGADGAVLSGTRKAAVTVIEGEKRVIVRDNYTGTVDQVNTDLLQMLLATGYLPVLCPPALSHEHELINIDGDRAAAAVAAALCASDLVLLSDVRGLLRDLGDPQSVVPEVWPDTFDQCMKLAKGSMKKKLFGAREAVNAGVGRAILARGQGAAPLREALAGQGTIVHGPRAASSTAGISAPVDAV